MWTYLIYCGILWNSYVTCFKCVLFWNYIIYYVIYVNLSDILWNIVEFLEFHNRFLACHLQPLYSSNIRLFVVYVRQTDSKFGIRKHVSGIPF